MLVKTLGSGYESLLYGHVVDMLQFPMFESLMPKHSIYLLIMIASLIDLAYT